MATVTAGHVGEVIVVMCALMSGIQCEQRYDFKNCETGDTFAAEQYPDSALSVVSAGVPLSSTSETKPFRDKCLEAFTKLPNANALVISGSAGSFDCAFYEIDTSAAADNDITLTSNALATTYVKDLQPCTSVVCDNGGSCEALSFVHFRCNCPDTHQGERCEVEKNPCDPNPCLNDGTCLKLTPLDYNCTCPNTHEGTQCQIEKDPCDETPCQNGGTCLKLILLDFNCTCPATHEGATCNVEKDPCDATPCQNDGTCLKLTPLTYNCTCPNTHEGAQCQIEKDPCDNTPCQNGGTCLKLSPLSYNCTCPNTHQGLMCETEKDPCDATPCQNSGTCLKLTPLTYNCTCPYTHKGTACEAEVNPCDEGPCQNGGTCHRVVLVDSVDFNCTCTASFLGKDCSVPVPDVHLDFNSMSGDGITHHGTNFITSPLGNQGLEFDGVSSWAHLGHFPSNCFPAPLTCPNGMTVSLWLKTEHSGTGLPAGVVTSRANSPKRHAFAIWVNSANTLYYQHYQEQISKYRNFMSGVSNPMNTWIHSVLTITSSNFQGGMRVYHNGAEVSHGTWQYDFTPDTATAHPMEIAAGRWYVDHDGNYLACKIDDVMFWDQALSAEQALVLYNTYS